MSDQIELQRVVTDMNRAFSEFKATHTASLATADVVTTDKLARVNAGITALEAQAKELNSKLAALSVRSGSEKADENEHVRAHRSQLLSYVRKGAEGDLSRLEVKAALTTESNPDGGYVVSREMDTQITRFLGTTSAMRSIASVRSIGGNSFERPHVIGGLAGGWVAERGARPETATGTLAMLRYPTHELYAEPAATGAMLDDALFDIESYLASEIAITFAEMEGDSFILGDGVGKPQGFLSAPKVANASYAWGSLGFFASGQAATLQTDPDGFHALLDVVYGLKRGYRENARWLMNEPTQAALRKLQDGQGVYQWQPSPQADQPATLLGYPVETDDSMPAIGANTFPIAFGDFNRGYQIVDRVGTRMLRDPYSTKPFVLFYATKRVGGGVQDYAAIKLLKISA